MKLRKKDEDFMGRPDNIRNNGRCKTAYNAGLMDKGRCEPIKNWGKGRRKEKDNHRALSVMMSRRSVV